MGTKGRPFGSETLRAGFCITLGVLQVLFDQFNSLYDLFRGLGFEQIWIVTLKPWIGFGDWVGLWGTYPGWGAWLYGAAFVGIGVASYWRDTRAVELAGAVFFGTNLVLNFLLYLWSEWGTLGEFLVGDVLYTLLMGVGIALFVLADSPVSTLRESAGTTPAAATPAAATGRSTEAANGDATATDAHAVDDDTTRDVNADAGGVTHSESADGAERTATEERPRLQERVASLRETVDDVERLLDAGDHRRARSTLSGMAEAVDRAKRTAVDNGWYDLNEELTTIERRWDRLSERCDRSADRSTDRSPSEIPTAPDVAVEYGALTDREPIGAGGNADVTKAVLPTPTGDVTLAIKQPRLSGTLHADQVDRLLDEAETWDRLDDHDHVVGVVDYGAEPLPWIAMEYMDGGDLSERGGALGLPQARWTALSITRGVRHAHRRGVAHLDLKPSNVLFRSVEGAWDVPKVADWGLSKHLLDHSNSVEGLSPQYAAPEQFSDEFGSTDDLTDVYQLGAVCYELFTGRPPFDGKPAEAMHRALYEAPTPPSEIAALPPALDDVLLTALAKEKADRYDDIVYLRDDLRDLPTDW
jgi:hypothetical protein